MPLTNTGKKVLGKFEKEYGSKKGKSVFYAKENKSGSFAEAMTNALHKKSESKIRHEKRDILYTHGMKHAGKDNYKPSKQFPEGY